VHAEHWQPSPGRKLPLGTDLDPRRSRSDRPVDRCITIHHNSHTRGSKAVYCTPQCPPPFKSRRAYFRITHFPFVKINYGNHSTDWPAFLLILRRYFSTLGQSAGRTQISRGTNPASRLRSRSILFLAAAASFT
jgi:hypothetical protein